MNIAARLARFEDRGFNRETAAVNVLFEQALQVLLSALSAGAILDRITPRKRRDAAE
jgi:hypothetical protein